MGFLATILNATPPQLAVGGSGVALFSYLCTTKERYQWISEAHAIPAVAMASLSLMEVLPEWAPGLYTTTYMIIDGMVMVYRLLKGDPWPNQDWMFVAHHFGCLPMFFHPITGPKIFYDVRMTSKVMMVEWSTPLLARWERYRRYSDFVMLFGVFVACRSVWLGFLIKESFQNKYDDFLTCFAVALWMACMFTWVIPKSKLLNYDAHEAFWRQHDNEQSDKKKSQ